MALKTNGSALKMLCIKLTNFSGRKCQIKPIPINKNTFLYPDIITIHWLGSKVTLPIFCMTSMAVVKSFARKKIQQNVTKWKVNSMAKKVQMTLRTFFFFSTFAGKYSNTIL